MIKFTPFTNERGDKFEGILLKRYLDASKYTRNKKVLDIGCGLGYGSLLIANKGAKSVTGIDNSSIAIKYARKKHQKPNLNFTKMDALNLSFINNSFDVIICFELIEHLSPQSHVKFVHNMHQSLTKNGICICSTPNKLISSPNRIIPYNPYHTKEYKPSEIKNLFKKYFKVVRLKGYSNVNKKFLIKETKIKNTKRYKFVALINRSKIIQEITPFIPKKIKNLLTQEDKLPSIKYKYFKLTEDIKNAECLLVIAYN